MRKEYISESLLWNERIWKQLQTGDNFISSALLFGKKGLGKAHVSIQLARKILGYDDVFFAANHPDLHVLMPEDEILDTIDSDEAEDISNSAIKLLALYGSRYIDDVKKPKKIISVEQVRRLIKQIVQHPHKSSHKVIIIKSADKMNVNSANALLKILEEPPENTSFLLIVSQVERLPITIRSRCTHFHFRSPDKEIGLAWLSNKGVQQHIESYLMMAGRAPLSAFSLSKTNEMENLRKIFTTINDLWRGQMSAIDLAEQWKIHKEEDIFNHLSRFLFDLLKLKSIDKIDVGSSELFYPVQKEWIAKIARTVDFEKLCKTIDQLSEIKKLNETPVDKLLLLEKVAISFEKLAA